MYLCVHLYQTRETPYIICLFRMALFLKYGSGFVYFVQIDLNYEKLFALVCGVQYRTNSEHIVFQNCSKMHLESLYKLANSPFKKKSPFMYFKFRDKY